MNTQPSKGPPKKALFLAQPFGTLVGKGKPFKTLWDLCKWAANEAGFNAVTLPAGDAFMDIGKVLSSDAYGSDMMAKYAKCGTPALRFEMHTLGQQMLMHPSDFERYKGFGADFGLGANATVSDYETTAEARALEVVQASAKLGFREVVDFSGNRGWVGALYPWSAYPKEWRLYILLLVLLKHRRVLAECAKFGIMRCLELHPMEDINSPLLLYMLRELAKVVAPETVPAIKALADASHPGIAGDEADVHFEFMDEENLIGADHLKDMEDAASFLAPTSLVRRAGSRRGDFFKLWSNSPARFCTFGTGKTKWEKIIPIFLKLHEQWPNGFPFVVEAECSKFTDMRQALKIASANVDRAIAGKPLDAGSGVVPKQGEDNWEQFCTSDTPPTTLLRMSPAEIAGVQRLKERLTPALLELV